MAVAGEDQLAIGSPPAKQLPRRVMGDAGWYATSHGYGVDIGVAIVIAAESDGLSVSTEPREGF